MIVPFAPCSMFAPCEQPRLIAVASTLQLMDKSAPVEGQVAPDNKIPQGSHWADVTEAGTVLVIDQPSHHTCAAVGGIMAARMKVNGLKGCIVNGRVRDISELKKSGLPVRLSNPSHSQALSLCCCKQQ